jgi:uroporphyrinogen decarboxylase
VTSREKFLATMDFDTFTLPPLYEFGYWAGTIRRWYREGLLQIDGIPPDIPSGKSVGGSLPFKVECKDLERVVNFDKPAVLFPVKSWIFPEFKVEVIEESKDGSKIIIDEMGIKKRIGKENDSIPEYYEWPVKNRDNWERFKLKRLNPATPGRYNDNLNRAVEFYKNRDFPLMMGGEVGFFGPLRYLLGEVKLLTFYYDQPALIKDMICYLVDFWIEVYHPLLSKIKPDCFLMWEDMCYKTGPLISPEIFQEFMLPAYKKFTSLLKGNGVDIIIVDTDGNCWELIPVFIEGGVTCIYPMEVAAGMDIVEVRKKFPKLQMTGGIDKRVLAKDKSSIDRELEGKIPYMIKQGGYIPHIDHNIPPDVPFGNFIYYRKRLEELIGKINGKLHLSR